MWRGTLLSMAAPQDLHVGLGICVKPQLEHLMAIRPISPCVVRDYNSHLYNAGLQGGCQGGTSEKQPETSVVLREKDQKVIWSAP